MKKTILLGLFLLASISSFAQLTLGGGVTFSDYIIKVTSPNGTTYNEVDNFGLNFFPRIGYFFKPNILAGFDLGYNVAKRNDLYYGKQTSKAFTIGPFFRYIYRVSNLIGLSAEARTAVGLGISKNEGTIPSEANTFSTIVNIRPSILLFASKHLFFDVSYGALRYTYAHAKDKNSGYVINDHAFICNVNLIYTYLGINYVF